jgi:cytochrome b561
MDAFTPTTIAALIIAASFAAGLNVYATLLTLGLLARAHWIQLPVGLDVVTHWWVIIVSGFMFAIEFVADKIPAFDMIWNGLHTFVRVPVAALLAYRASEQLSPEMQILAATAGAGIALVSHGSKTAMRAAVTPSPEPVSNIVLSTTEDVMAVGVTWLATKHPLIAAGIACGFLLVAVITVRWLARFVRKMWRKPRPANA